MRADPSTSKRSIAKAITWETFSSLVCFGLAYATFGNLGGCAVFTVVCFVVKLILFYYHERMWHQIRWGKCA
jgi:adenylylsulfate kinase